MKLELEIYDRNKVIFTYLVGHEECNSFWGKTQEDYYFWLSLKDWDFVTKETYRLKVAFALETHFPNEFYRFIRKK